MRLQRGWRKRERVHSNSGREKRLKGREGESEPEADAELKAGGRQVFGQLPGLRECRERLVITFSLEEGGRGRLITTALSALVSDR